VASDVQIELIFRYRIRPGSQSRYDEYLAQALPVVEKQEPYISSYRINRSTDGVYLQHEVYEDEAAVHRHMELTASAQQAFAESTELIDVMTIGPLSDRFWDAYSGPNMSSYHRWHHVRR
jgi:quinol monooxygenase YgiN